MIKRCFAAALLVVFSSMLFVGHARAQTSYTSDSLAAVMLTTGDVNAVLSTFGTGQSVTDSADSSPGSDNVIRAARLFKTQTALIVVALFSNADGSAPNSTQRDGVLTAQYLYQIATGVFDPIRDFTVGGTLGLGDADQFVLFTGVINGNPFNVVSETFIKGNVFAVILFATPLDNDGTTLGGLVGGQLLKLP